MEDLIQVSDKIEQAIKNLSRGRLLLQERAEAKSNAIANYDKEMAKVLIQLKNGVEFELDGSKVSNPLAAVIKEIAKGICWKVKLELDKAEALYKNSIVGLSVIQAELNGWQSIYRHLVEK